MIPFKSTRFEQRIWPQMVESNKSVLWFRSSDALHCLLRLGTEEVDDSKNFRKW